MEIITVILQYLKFIPEGLTAVIVIIAVIASLFFKKKDVDLSQVTSISKLQTEQLTQLINQNSQLAEQLKLVRVELSEAHLVINDLRLRIAELEDTLRNKPIKE
jgi:hypothetical protein